MASIDRIIQEYEQFLMLTNWTEMEVYKFEFGHWIRQNVDIDTENAESLCRIANKSQEIKYSGANYKGLQFVRNSARTKKSIIFGDEDGRIILELNGKRKISKELVKNRNMSYTGLTTWLGTILPHQYVPNPTTDFVDVFRYLFPKEEVPESGVKYFRYGQAKCNWLKSKIKSRGITTIYLDPVNRFRKRIGLSPVSRYGEIDYNWLVEDIWLYVHRVILELRDTSYITFNNGVLGSPELDTGSANRMLTTINRLKRNSKIISELKKKYDYKCQLCQKTIKGFGSRFVEGAHIRPLGTPHDGIDCKSNVLILCPNHHREFDLGQWSIDLDHRVTLPNKQPINLNHKIDPEVVEYHTQTIFKN